MVIAYLVGVLTLPLVAGMLAAFAWAASKNFGSACIKCGRIFREIGRNYRIATRLRSRMHQCRGE